MPEPTNAQTHYVDGSQLHALEHVYALRRPEEVISFLQIYPFLVELLVEAGDQIDTYFPRAQLYLEISEDTEAEDGNLLVSIGTNLDWSIAWDQLREFDKEWWIANLDRAQGNVIIALELG